MLLFFGNDELCSRRAAPATPKWLFLTIKKRLRQAASRGKWCFSLRNAILGKKKSACGKPPAGGKWFWSSPTREPLVLSNKGTIGSPKGSIGSPKGSIGSPKGTIGSPKGTIGSPHMVQKHQNRHEMVIHGSKSDGDPTKMIRKARSTRIRSSFCAKTSKMRV